MICTLAACRQEAEPPAGTQSISLADDDLRQAEAFQSPDTENASWSVSESGQAIGFGDDGESPWLTLACDLASDEPQFVIVRHAKALPGQSALFPFVGNGMRSRFLADAALAANEWRWEARLPADDPQLDIFAGSRRMTATLPGRGMLEIAGSRIPGEFLAWCRAGGELPTVEGDPAETEPGDET